MIIGSCKYFSWYKTIKKNISHKKYNPKIIIEKPMYKPYQYYIITIINGLLEDYRLVNALVILLKIIDFLV